MSWTTIRTALISLVFGLGLTIGTTGSAMADKDYEDGVHPSEAEDFEEEPSGLDAYGARGAEEAEVDEEGKHPTEVEDVGEDPTGPDEHGARGAE